MLSTRLLALFTLYLISSVQCSHAVRRPFGFGGLATGGTDGNASYTVISMSALRTVLQRPSPKTIIISGTLYGADVGNTSVGLADCDWYISTSAVPTYNFTLYLLSLNSTYMSLVSTAAAFSLPIDGYANATAYLTLLRRQNGMRPQAANSQKRWVAVEIPSNTTILGAPGTNAKLIGVNFVFSSISNVVVRNLHIVPPADCFPAPESWPSIWNARYDAISVITASNLWFDGLVLQSHPNATLALEPFIDGWLVDRYDGLMDIEDGADNITLSHSTVANHGKSLLFGGGNKEAERDLGRMRITLWGNRFENSRSRNPLMRFGTYEVVNNVFVARNDRSPLWGNSRDAGVPQDIEDAKPFQYHMGIYNQSRLLTRGNAFIQTGRFPDDLSRIFSYSDLTRPDIPAKYCVEEEQSWGSIFNGMLIDLKDVQQKTMDYNINRTGKIVDSGLVFDCTPFQAVRHTFPRYFRSAQEMEKYVNDEAGH